MSKVEKIRKEIERLKKSLPWGSCASQLSMECNCKNEAYNEVLSYIDSLKEPVKRTPAEIEAAMQEIEEKSKLFTEAHKDDVVSNDPISNPLEISRHGNSHIGETLEKAAGNYAFTMSGEDEVLKYYAFIAGAQWQKENLWKPADGDDLPEIDREVIALIDNGKVVFAHRPPEYWDGKNILTGEVTRYKPKRYDNGGWDQPNVVYWLDVELPKE